MKKIGKILLVLTLMFVSLFSVNAYTQNIVISDDILMTETHSTVKLIGELKNKDSKVYHQYVVLTDEQYRAIITKQDQNASYVDAQSKILKEKNDAVKEAEELANSLKDDISKQQDYEAAYTNYLNLLDQFEKYEATVSKTIESNDAELQKLIPSYDDTKWSQVSLKQETSTYNEYNLPSSGAIRYMVSWVKVSLNSEVVYNYDIYCNIEEPENPVCKIENGKYYDNNGKEVTEAEYKLACEPQNLVCKIENGKYYDNNGKEVTEAEYKLACEPQKPVCKIENGKYYDENGDEVTKVEYELSCGKPMCKIENGKYYDASGNEVDKDKYEASCNPENPKTGLYNSYIYGMLIILIAYTSYIIVKKTKKLSR